MDIKLITRVASNSDDTDDVGTPEADHEEQHPVATIIHPCQIFSTTLCTSITSCKCEV